MDAAKYWGKKLGKTIFKFVKKNGQFQSHDGKQTFHKPCKNVIMTNSQTRFSLKGTPVTKTKEMQE